MSGEFKTAIVRRPGPDFGTGLTTATGEPPDFEKALEQHRAYIEALARLGVDVVELDALSRFPDAYFVEDTAVVCETVAVVTRPGAEERRGEEESIEPVLARFRPIERIGSPGTVDGGDVLEVGDHFLIGVSDRTNEEGAGQLGEILSRHGKTWSAMAVGSGLHLKSSLAALDDETLLVTPEYVNRQELKAWEKVVVETGEEYAANTLAVNGTLLVPAGYPGVLRKLEARGFPLVVLDVSEARRMDGGLSCMSLRF
ncbi:MAG: arginine deiminase family protein [Acidobacteriota bacterium]|nr:arginine deiminase family protein [Acidobacteriota bacterium]